MQYNVMWKALEYNSFENCIVSTSELGHEVHSTVVGHYQQTIYMLEYYIRTTLHWETLFVELRIQHDDKREHQVFEADGKGNWFQGGKRLEHFFGCMDVDISLTPFTNTLPINRLNLKVDESRKIQVLYFDILAMKTEKKDQLYRRKDELVYAFETVPDDFKATIEVNEQGFVLKYPSLFECSQITLSNYP